MVIIGLASAIGEVIFGVSSASLLAGSWGLWSGHGFVIAFGYGSGNASHRYAKLISAIVVTVANLRRLS